MLRGLTLLAAYLFAFCVQGADGPAPGTGKAPQLLLVGSETNDLGNITGYEKKTSFFRFKNTGEAPGEIVRIIPSCACIRGAADQSLIGPQEETVIRVALDPTKVHEVAFIRNIWIESNDPAWPRFRPFYVKGEVRPLFKGVPDSPQQAVLAEGTSWTHRFTLSEAETNLFVGQPRIDTDTNKLSATATVVTNTAQGKTSFDITLAVTARASGSHNLLLSLPVEGLPNLRPIKLTVCTRDGSELKVIPSKIVLTATEQPLTRRLNVVTPDKDLLTNALTWTPRREGVSVLVQPGSKQSLVTVTLTLTPEAVAKLLQEKEATLTFHYPECPPASLAFIGAPVKPTEPPQRAKEP